MHSTRIETMGFKKKQLFRDPPQLWIGRVRVHIEH